MNRIDDFQIALSYASEDAWIAKDIHELLSSYAMSVYCYDRMPDETRGLLRDNLREIYNNSWLNILIWSRHYSSKSSTQPDSFVAMERRFIAHRHINKGQAETLVIIQRDGTTLGSDLDYVLAHDIRATGVLAIERLAVERLAAISKRPTSNGIVCHPPSTAPIRSTPRDCNFTIISNYRNDPYQRWEKLADVWVNFPNEHGTACVYLMPSGFCTALLRHTGRFRTEPRYLDIKRAATEAFVASVGQRSLIGHWFLEKKPERDIVALYCGEYDRFLNENFESFLPSKAKEA